MFGGRGTLVSFLPCETAIPFPPTGSPLAVLNCLCRQNTHTLHPSLTRYSVLFREQILSLQLRVSLASCSVHGYVYMAGVGEGWEWVCMLVFQEQLLSRHTFNYPLDQPQLTTVRACSFCASTWSMEQDGILSERNAVFAVQHLSLVLSCSVEDDLQ